MFVTLLLVPSRHPLKNAAFAALSQSRGPLFSVGICHSLHVAAPENALKFPTFVVVWKGGQVK